MQPRGRSFDSRTSQLHVLTLGKHSHKCVSIVKQYTLCPKKRPPFYFSNNSVKTWPMLMIFGCKILRKYDINSVYICLPHLYTVATLPWKIQKSFFNSTIQFLNHDIKPSVFLTTHSSRNSMLDRLWLTTQGRRSWVKHDIYDCLSTHDLTNSPT